MNDAIQRAQEHREYLTATLTLAEGLTYEMATDNIRTSIEVIDALIAELEALRCPATGTP